MQIKVLSYNIHKGFSLFNQRYLIDEIKQALRSTGADIIFLQEILGYHPHKKELAENGFENQLEYFADQLWPHHAYGKNAVYNKGHHGNAILSRFPFQSWENIDISTNRWEQRGLLHATVDVSPEGPPLHLFNVHLNLLEKSRFKQVERIISRASDHVPDDGPLLLGGDFNDWRQSLSGRLLKSQGLKSSYKEKHGHHARTFPLKFPFLCLDRIYYRNMGLHDIHRLHGEPWANLSDHYPLLAEFEV